MVFKDAASLTNYVDAMKDSLLIKNMLKSLLTLINMQAVMRHI